MNCGWQFLFKKNSLCFISAVSVKYSLLNSNILITVISLFVKFKCSHYGYFPLFVFKTLSLSLPDNILWHISGVYDLCIFLRVSLFLFAFCLYTSFHNITGTLNTHTPSSTTTTKTIITEHSFEFVLVWPFASHPAFLLQFRWQQCCYCARYSSSSSW